MLKLARTAMKYFAFGLIAGILVAPQSGERTRQVIRDKARTYLDMFLGFRPEAEMRMGEEARATSTSHPEAATHQREETQESEERVH